MNIVIALVAVILFAFIVFRMLNTGGNAAENIRKGDEFLEKNALKEGVQTTASGLQYLALKEGEGTVHPVATDKVTVHYHGKLINGTVFDSSVRRGQPIAFGLNQVIQGWTEGVQLMVVGEKTRFFIPSKLAYGNQVAGKIGAGSTLIFEVELLGIND